jgi:hypothetical protein
MWWTGKKEWATPRQAALQMQKMRMQNSSPKHCGSIHRLHGKHQSLGCIEAQKNLYLRHHIRAERHPGP